MLISICAGPSRSNWDLIAKLSSGQIAPRRPGERQLDSKNEETSKINRISQYTANNPRDINHLLSVTFCTQMTRTPVRQPALALDLSHHHGCSATRLPMAHSSAPSSPSK